MERNFITATNLSRGGAKVAKLVTFGETMIRLSVPMGKRLENTASLDVTVGGSEMNVAVDASRLGLQAAWVSKLPANGWGRHIINVCRQHGVATHVVWDPSGRCGLYFVEFGASPRPTEVLYDRSNSAFASIVPGEIDWETALSGADVFLTSGITTAVCGLEVTEEAIGAAKRMGIKVAFDINYRSKLWDAATARIAYQKIMPQVDILFVSGSDAVQFLSVSGRSAEELLVNAAQEYGWDVAAMVHGSPPHSKSPWRVLAYSAGRLYTDDREIRLDTVDRIGAGDAFAAGFLAGYLTDGPQLGLQYGQAMLALKNTFFGDISWATLDDVKAFVAGSGGSLIR